MTDQKNGLLPRFCNSSAYLWRLDVIKHGGFSGSQFGHMLDWLVRWFVNDQPVFVTSDCSVSH